MPIELDETDIAILQALIEDGRRPFRQIAKLASVSTPTVENRIRRMFDAGLIKKIILVLDTDKIEHGIIANVTLKVDFSKLEEVIRTLEQIEEVRSIYVAAGENNLIINVFADDVKTLQEFLTKNIAQLKGVTIISSNIIARIVKEQPWVILKPGIGVQLTCDFCGKKIKDNPETFKIGDSERFFCCKICRVSYREKYKDKIETLTKKE